MKKSGIVHKGLAACIASAGHYDQFALVSCLYGIPKDASVIDLALVRGTPNMSAVLEAIRGEMVIEKLTIAGEMEGSHRELHDYIRAAFAESQIETVPNDSLKRTAEQSKCYIRTGENIPYSNIVIQAGFSVG